MNLTKKKKKKKRERERERERDMKNMNTHSGGNDLTANGNFIFLISKLD